MAKKQNNDQVKKAAEAKAMYMNTNLSQKEICVLVGWTEKTFSLHKKQGNWEAEKGARTTTNQNIIIEIYKKIEKQVAEDTLNADAILKLAKSIDMLSDKKTTASQLIAFGEMLCVFLLEEDEFKPLAKPVNKAVNLLIQRTLNNGN